MTSWSCAGPARPLAPRFERVCQVGGWTAAWARPEAGGDAEMLVLAADGRAYAPVPLARRIAAGQPVHDLPVSLVDCVLAVAVLAMAAEAQS